VERLSGQQVEPSQPRRRHRAAEQREHPLELLAGGSRLAELHVRLAEQAVPTRPFQNRQRVAPKGGGQDRLRLAEPALAVVQRPETPEVRVEPGRLRVGDQPVGRGPQVLDLGVQRLR